MTHDTRLIHESFPRTNTYTPDWIIANASGGANSLWLTEWLAPALALKPGMNILDLGCGCAAQSIFLAREYNVRVWATDLWFSASDNLQRIRAAGVEDKVFPIHADARSLPFANDVFDAILSIDAFPYFGTDHHYLNYLARFVKPGGIIALAGAGLLQEFQDEPPSHLRQWWSAEAGLWSMHSAPWWRQHWQRTGIVDVELADTMPDGWKLWLQWHQTVAPDNKVEIDALQADHGRNLGYYRVVARRRPDVELQPPIGSIPSPHVPTPMLRDSR